MSSPICIKHGTVISAAKSGATALELAERYCLLGSSYAYSEYEEGMIEITKKTSEFFNVSSKSLQICGSAKLGFSPVKKRPFVAGSSDLDLAILDSSCFGRYLEIVALETGDLQDRTLFANDDAIRRYKSLLARGIIRSDILPAIAPKIEWDKFFTHLTIEHSVMFSKITAAVYLSDRAFVRKQAGAFSAILEGES